MTWTTPLLAALAAAVVIPTLLILYFLKLRRRDVEISTTLLWKQAIQDLQANAPFQKLRRNILLLLQLLALIAALFAIAQPNLTRGEERRSRQIIMIDRSASMNALDGDESGASRLDAAKERAIEQIESLREGGLFGGGSADQAMVIVFDRSARVVQPFTTDKRALRDAINAITPTDSAGSLDEAFRLARAQSPRQFIENIGLVSSAPVTMHLYTDGRLADSGEVLGNVEDEVVYHAIGSETSGNVGLTALRAERGYNEPTELTIFIGLQNDNDQPVTADVELLIDGTPVRIERVTLPATQELAPEELIREDEDAEDAPELVRRPGSGGLVFELSYAESAIATVRVRLRDASTALDALPTDNLGHLVIPPARQTSVAVVTEGNLFLASAMGGLPLGRLDTLTPAEFEAARRDGSLATYDVVLLDGLLPERASEAEPALPPGRWLVLGASPPPPFGVEVERVAEGARFVDWDRQHPSLRYTSLDPVVIAAMPVVTVPEGSPAEVIAETTRGPGLLDIQDAETRAIVVPFDVAQSNWPFDVGFVVFLASSIDVLGRGTATLESGGASEITPGGVLADRLPPGARRVRVREPNDLPPTAAGAGQVANEIVETLEPSAGGRITYGPIERAGVYRVSWGGPATEDDVDAETEEIGRLYAANLLDAFESVVRTQPVLTLGNLDPLEGQGETADENRPLWPYLILVAIAIMLFEWWVYNRKVYI